LWASAGRSEELAVRDRVRAEKRVVVRYIARDFERLYRGYKGCRREEI
jgi:hypothetical protein